MLLFSLGTLPLMLGLGTLVSALGRCFAQTVLHIGAVLVAVLGLAMLSQGGALSGMLPPEHLLFLVVGLAVVGVAASVPVPGRAYRVAGIAVAVAVVLSSGLVWRQFGKDPADSGSTVQVMDGVQIVSSTLSPGKYPTIMVQAGLPVQWSILAPEGSVNGCNYRVIIREYGVVHDFTEGENIIEFTPTDTGTVSYTCWMGMIQGSIVVT